MYKYSKRSLKRISELHPDLQTICFELIKLMDVTILEGHRNKEKQDKAYKDGNSFLKWPNSKHNLTPSLAVDIAPYPINWTNIERFEYMLGLVQGIAHEKNIRIRLGKDFKNLNDYPHIELY